VSFKIRCCIKNYPDKDDESFTYFALPTPAPSLSCRWTRPARKHDFPDLRFLEYRAPGRHLSRPSDIGSALGDDLDKILIGVFVHLDSRVICGSEIDVVVTRRASGNTGRLFPLRAVGVASVAVS
jgi:hypothetical protein